MDQADCTSEEGRCSVGREEEEQERKRRRRITWSLIIGWDSSPVAKERVVTTRDEKSSALVRGARRNQMAAVIRVGDSNSHSLLTGCFQCGSNLK